MTGLTRGETTPALFADLTAHCFFTPRCAHTERALTPDTLHAQMEQHYEERHLPDIRLAIGIVPRAGRQS